MVKTIEILSIVSWLCENMEEIIKNGVEIFDVIEEPMAHPHYHSREVFTIEYDKEKGVVSDLALSGSPSAWNHYINPVYSYIELAKEISSRIEEIENIDVDMDYKVHINESLKEKIEDDGIIHHFILCEEW